MENNTNFNSSEYSAFCEEILQQYPDTCAIKSQQLILESNGIHVSEAELREEAFQNGWYIPGEGSTKEEVGNLAYNHGMEVHKYQEATVRDIANELAQGHQVIVGVDSGELWNPGPDETFEDLINGKQADHALLVSGIVVDPLTAEQCVLLTDPGTGDLCMDYHAEQFEDAWDDSDNFMVSIM